MNAETHFWHSFALVVVLALACILLAVLFTGCVVDTSQGPMDCQPLPYWGVKCTPVGKASLP